MKNTRKVNVKRSIIIQETSSESYNSFQFFFFTVKNTLTCIKGIDKFNFVELLNT